MKLQSTGDNYRGIETKPITLEINNEDELYELLDIIKQLQQRAADIATAMAKEKGGKYSISPDEVRFEDGSIRAETEEYLGCGEWDVHGIDIPLDYFFDENYLDDVKEKIRKMEEEKKRKAEAAAAKRKADDEARERAQYLKLKEKYGENN